MTLTLRRGALLAALAVAAPLALPGVALAAPPQPTHVLCQPSGTGQIDVSTYDVYDETTTDVRDALSGRVWTFTSDEVGYPYDATLTGLDPDQQYQLQIRYTDSDGTSAWSKPCPAVYARPIVGNLVLNPSADLGLAYWHGVNAKLALASGGSPGWGGKASISVRRSSGAQYGLTDFASGGLPTVVDARGRAYEGAAWVKAASASAAGKPVTIALTERTPSGATVRTTASRATTLTTGWRQVWVTAPVRHRGDTVGVEVRQGSATAGDAMTVDDVRAHPFGSVVSTVTGRPEKPRKVDPDVKRVTGVDMTPCSPNADLWINCEVETDLTKYSAYVDGLAGKIGSASIRGVIYADDGSGSAPSTLIASTRSVVVHSGQAAKWVDLPLDAPVELGSRTYWFGYQVGGDSGVLRFYGDDGVWFCEGDCPIGIWAADAYADGPSRSFGPYHDASLNTEVRGTGGR